MRLRAIVFKLEHMNSPEIERERVTLVEAPVQEPVSPASEPATQAAAQVTVEAPPSGEQLIPALVKPNAWSKIVLKPRVDSFNQGELISEINEALASGATRLALDLSGNRFVSVAVIKICAVTAQKLADQGGIFALLGCPERTKRHFEVYGTLDDIRMVRTEAELERIKTRA